MEDLHIYTIQVEFLKIKEYINKYIKILYILIYLNIIYIHFNIFQTVKLLLNIPSDNKEAPNDNPTTDVPLVDSPDGLEGREEDEDVVDNDTVTAVLAVTIPSLSIAESKKSPLPHIHSQDEVSEHAHVTEAVVKDKLKHKGDVETGDKSGSGGEFDVMLSCL